MLERNKNLLLAASIEMYKSGKISIGELARRLGMKKETAAEWCQVLEKNGMVSIEYPPFKDPIVHDIPSSADGKEKNGFK